MAIYIGIIGIVIVKFFLNNSPLPKTDFSYFHKWPCYRGASGRFLLISYMTMPAWVWLAAWFVFKYVF